MLNAWVLPLSLLVCVCSSSSLPLSAHHAPSSASVPAPSVCARSPAPWPVAAGGPEQPAAPSSFAVRRHDIALAFKEQARALWGAVTQREIFLPALFVLLWQVRCGNCAGGGGQGVQGGQGLGVVCIV